MSGKAPPSPQKIADFKSQLLIKALSTTTTLRKGSPWRSANKLLCDEENTLLVDFVARYENRQEDLAYIGERIGFPELGKIIHVNRIINPELGKVVHISNNLTKSEFHYSEYYDDEMRDKVAELCRWEIERFNYSFDK